MRFTDLRESIEIFERHGATEFFLSGEDQYDSGFNEYVEVSSEPSPGLALRLRELGWYRSAIGGLWFYDPELIHQEDFINNLSESE